MPVVGPSVAEPRASGAPSRPTASADRDPSGRGWRDQLVGQAVYGGYRLGALASQLVPGRRVPSLAGTWGSSARSPVATAGRWPLGTSGGSVPS